MNDPEEHPWLPLSSAKGWLHPHIEPSLQKGSLSESLKNLSLSARGPRGFVCSSKTQLHSAFIRLKEDNLGGNSRKIVLKPSWESGGNGILFDVQESDIEKIVFPGRYSDFVSDVILEEELIDANKYSVILEEELIADPILEKLNCHSPCLFMLGMNPLEPAMADQVFAATMEGKSAVNLGNQLPSKLHNLSDDKAGLADEATGAIEDAVKLAKHIQTCWDLQSHWGMDFLIVREEGKLLPICVDINMGRPNGNIAVRMWDSTNRNLHKNPKYFSPQTGTIQY